MKRSFARFASSLLSIVLIVSCESDRVDPPEVTANDFSVSINENPENGEVLGTIDAFTTGGTLTFAITSQTPGGAVAVNNETGELSVADSSLFQFATNPEITGTVEVSNGFNSQDVLISISINDPSSTVLVSDFDGIILQNPAQGDIIGVLDAVATEGTLSFALIDQTPAGAVAVNAQTGELSVADASLFVTAINPEITGSVEVTNGIDTRTITFTIEVTPFNIWSGPSLTFTKNNGADPTLEANQDRITDNVWITRGNSGGQIYNARVASQADKSNSPLDTEWAIGTTADIDNLIFAPFRTTVRPRTAPGESLVLHLITDDIYIDVEFISWTSGSSSGGGFSYERSTE